MADYQYRGLPSSVGPQGSSQYGPSHSSRDPAVRIEDHTTLPKSISTSDLDQLELCRESVKRDFVAQPPPGGANFFSRTTSCTLTLPSLNNDSPSFKKFVYNNLVDNGIRRHLEDGHVINWCESVSTLIPLNTLRDGNCLLHAASLAMWGFQDRNTTLRGALSTALRDVGTNTLYQRWKENRELENHKVGLELEPQQWEREWHDMVRQASPEVQDGKNFESLDDFHIFVLANVLRRPVIMYASTKYRSMGTDGTLQETNIQGVYLPLLWDPKVCKRDPLPLAYDGGHFTALVPEDGAVGQDGIITLPLVDYNGKELSKKFTLHVEANIPLARDYLNLIQRPCNMPYTSSNHILCANLAVVEPPAISKLLMSSYLQACRDMYRREEGRSGRDDRVGGDMRADDGRGGGYDEGRGGGYGEGRGGGYGEGRGGGYAGRDEWRGGGGRDEERGGGYAGRGGGGGGHSPRDEGRGEGGYAGRDEWRGGGGYGEGRGGGYEGRDMYREDGGDGYAGGRGGGRDGYPGGRGGGRDGYAGGRGGGGEGYAGGRGGGGEGYAGGREDGYAGGRGRGGEGYAGGRGGGEDGYAGGRGGGEDGYAGGRGGGEDGYAGGRGGGGDGGRGGGGDVRGIEEGGERTKCVNSCGNYGVADYSYMCTNCYRKYMEATQKEQFDHPNIAENWSEAGRGGGNKFSGGGGGNSQHGMGGGGGGGSIKCPKCSKPGNPQLLGMCQGCFSGNPNAGPPELPHDGESIYEPLPGGGGGGAAAMGGEPPALPLPRNAKERSLCRKPGCKYYGTPENRFYCSRCFELDMENILKEVDEGVPLMPGPPAEEPFSQAQQPSYQPAGHGGEPPKCYKCNEFFADEAYGGMCTECFMKSTVKDEGGGGGLMSPRDRQFQGQRRHDSVKETRDNFTPNPSYGPVFNPTAPQSAYQNPAASQYQPAYQDQRERRPPITTEPITTLESKMADVTMTSRCFLCNPGNLGSSQSFTVCRYHATDMYQMIQQKHGGDMGRQGGGMDRRGGEGGGMDRRGGEGGGMDRRGGEGGGMDRRGSDRRGDREDEVRSKPRRGESVSSQYSQVLPRLSTGNVSEPEWSGRPAAPYQNYEGEHLYENGGNGQRRPNSEHLYVNDPQRWSDQGRYKDEQNFPPQSSKEPKRFGNEQEYPIYGNDQHEDDFVQEQVNVGGYPRGGGAGGVTGRGGGAGGVAGRGGGAGGVAGRGGEAGGVAGRGGGAESRAGGAVGGAGESMKEPPGPRVKLLCAQVGCSFRGYKELKNLCPDCYREHYDPTYDSNEFPLA